MIACEGGGVRMRTPSFLLFILQSCQWTRLYESIVRVTDKLKLNGGCCALIELLTENLPGRPEEKLRGVSVKVGNDADAIRTSYLPKTGLKRYVR